MELIIKYCDLCKKEVDELYSITLPNTPNHEKNPYGEYIRKKIKPQTYDICNECCYDISNAILEMKINQILKKKETNE